VNGWTELLGEPRMVTSIYGGEPDLGAFALEEVVLAGREAVLRGDFGALPAPLPRRWAERGFTRAGGLFRASGLVSLELRGAPRLGFDAGGCLQGEPVDLVVERAGESWAAPDGSRHPCVSLSGQSPFLTLRLVCEHLRVEVRGYEPAPY
jgi:hypothetical protein